MPSRALEVGNSGLSVAESTHAQQGQHELKEKKKKNIPCPAGLLRVKSSPSRPARITGRRGNAPDS